MRDSLAGRFSAIAPIIFMVLLAAVSFWLERTVQSSATTATPLRHDPDFWSENFNVKRFGTDGVLQNTLTAKYMQHFPDDDSTEVMQLRMVFHRQPPVEVSALNGLIGPDGDDILLTNKVRVTRSGSTKDAQPLHILTRELAIQSNKETAQSHGPVTIIQGASKIHGSGIEIDNKSGISIISGPVTGTIYPRK